MTKSIKIKIPATIGNVGSGFDCVGMALRIYNEIEMELIDRNKLEIEIEGEGSDVLPKDESNLVYYGFCEVFKRLKKSIPNVKIKQRNNIPLARGLGSSATARLGGILCGNFFCGNKLKKDEIISLATELEGHPDNIIPAFVGGLCVCYNYNGKIGYVKNRFPVDIKVVVCIPYMELLTTEARKILPQKVPLKDAVFNCSRVALLMISLKAKKYDLLKYAVEDKLHQIYRSNLIPGMYDVFNSAIDAGALCAGLSGAGPAVFAFVNKDSNLKKIGEKMCIAFLKHNIKSVFKILDVDNNGTRFF